MGNLKERNDLVGKRFGRLLVKEYSHNKGGSAYFVCICDCGNNHTARSSSLNTGNCNSCGCIRKELFLLNNTKHGMCYTRIYRVWQKMLDRCEDVNQHGYECYGGRGIKVCERWHTFIKFYNDVKEGYADNLTLDRYPNKNGDYEPNNFRWATWKEQARNRRTNSYLEYNGEKLTHAEWAEKLGLNYKIISNRIGYGWSDEKILTEPVRTKYWRNIKKGNLCLQESL